MSPEGFNPEHPSFGSSSETSHKLPSAELAKFESDDMVPTIIRNNHGNELRTPLSDAKERLVKSNKVFADLFKLLRGN